MDGCLAWINRHGGQPDVSGISPNFTYEWKRIIEYLTIHFLRCLHSSLILTFQILIGIPGLRKSPWISRYWEVSLHPAFPLLQWYLLQSGLSLSVTSHHVSTITLLKLLAGQISITYHKHHNLQLMYRVAYPFTRVRPIFHVRHEDGIASFQS